VMAAWLAYLKSCLLVALDQQVGADAQLLALRLQCQRRRLDARLPLPGPVALLWASLCAGHRVEKERRFPPDATNDDF